MGRSGLPLGGVVDYGYRAIIARDGAGIMSMLAYERYDVVLAEGSCSNEELDPKKCLQVKSLPGLRSDGIVGSRKENFQNRLIS